MRDRPWLVVLICAAGVLALAYNLRAYRGLWTQPKQQVTGSSDAAPAADDGSQGPRAQPVAPMSEDEVSKLIASLPPSGRDPFRFMDVAADGDTAPPPLALVLQGTLVGTRRVAWINQRPRSEGEQIDGQLIERIEADHVVMRKGREEYPLWPAR
jgi:hypothetical protein